MEPSLDPLYKVLDRNEHDGDIAVETWDAMIRDGAGPWAATEINVAEAMQSSPFCRLPLEIRMMIYHLIIGTRTWVVHKPDGPCESLSKYNWQLEHQSKKSNGAATAEHDVQTLWDTKSPLAIAFTCRQIYHEAAEIWYGNVGFCFFSVPCMAVFLAEIGATNRKSIRYIKYDRKWDSLNKQAPDVKQLICTHLVGLRHLTLYWDYYSRTENQWSFCEEDAHELLKLRDQLEVVILSKTHVRHLRTFSIPVQIGTVESLELKRDKGTGRVVTTSSTRKGCLLYRIPAGACGYDEEEDEKWFPKRLRMMSIV